MGSLEEKYAKILQKNGINNPISKVVIKDAGNLAGEHFSSVCQYVTVEFKEENIKPLKIFVKNILPSSNQKESEALEFIIIKEGKFLIAIVEELKCLCSTKNTTAALAIKEELGSMFPKTFYADKNEIIMEDLSSKGFLILKKTEKHVFTTVKLVLENLAVFHGVSHVWIKQNGGKDKCLQKYSYIAEPFDSEIIRQEYKDAIEPSITTLLKMLEMSSNVDQKSCHDIISEYKEKSTDAMISAVYETNEIFDVLDHGDLWNNNMMFTEQKDKIVFIDFQVMRINSPNLDILYYIFISGDSEVRKRLKELLKIYFNKIKNTVEMLGESFKFTFEDFLKDFKKRLPLGLVMGLWFGIGVEAMSGFNINESDGFHAQKFTDTVNKWIQENPSKAENALKVCCDIIRDFEQLKCN